VCGRQNEGFLARVGERSKRRRWGVVFGVPPARTVRCRSVPLSAATAETPKVGGVKLGFQEASPILVFVTICAVEKENEEEVRIKRDWIGLHRPHAKKAFCSEAQHDRCDSRGTAAVA
jgi:hypothetical protein